MPVIRRRAEKAVTKHGLTGKVLSLKLSGAPMLYFREGEIRL